MRRQARILLVLAPLCLLSCFSNNPYPSSEHQQKIFYDTFSEEPKRMDPARSYSSNEYEIICQIYEPLVQYHYLKRPYQLVPLTIEKIPVATFFDKDGQALPPDAPPDRVAKAVYDIRIKQGIRYQPHPCFAKNPDHSYRWHLGPEAVFPKIEHPDDLGASGTRELKAEDYVYQIKRLAHPQLQCPIFTVLDKNVVGFGAFYEELKARIAAIRAKRSEAGGVFYNQGADEKDNPIYIDLRTIDLKGVEVTGPYSFRITLKKKYPQFVYWLAMPFFSPVPWEADRFFEQGAASKQNLTLNRFPVGTGPFMLTVNQPNFRMVLARNPNFHEEAYPSEGAPGDREQGLLKDAGKKMPFLDKAVFVLEKEDVSSWNKFLQGYYDVSNIGSDVFDQAVTFSAQGAGLTDDLVQQGIVLRTSISPTTYYFAFNMLDNVVGGYDEKRKKLRQAISIAIDYEEYIQIFRNGRGGVAQGPIPPGIPGYQQGQAGINPFVYDWDPKAAAPRRKDIREARRLMAEAGYADGRDASGKQLVLFYDTTSGAAGDKAYLDWMRKQFKKIGVDLQIRSTDYNQFQEKVLKGNYQILSWGWHADYPDPENFLFLLHGPQGKVKSHGENAANYDSTAFNELFEQMENMSDSPERLVLIEKMLKICREDAPWIWGFHPKGYGLYHAWYKNAKPMTIGNNTLKFKRIDVSLRSQKRDAWNRPITWPLWVLFAGLVLGTVPAVRSVLKRERSVNDA